MNNEIKFLVTRTSISTEDIPPCEEASFEEVDVLIKVCNYKSIEDYKKKDFDNFKYWYASGINHRAVNEDGKYWLEADAKEKRWILRFKDIKELQDFYIKYGDLVICSATDFVDIKCCIEIYDDYRE